MSQEIPPIVFTGDLEEVHGHFLQQGWTDGLPIIPPTRDRVEKFLLFTPRSVDDVIAVLPPEQASATILSIAVNGVMAGCRPEYMPILVALVEAISDPVFRIEDAGSTPGWEYMPIVSGPLVEQLEFNHEAGVMRAGRQANTSIGRFLRLYMRNVPGYRIPPGATDKGSIGMSFSVALPESNRTLADLGWPSHAEDRGYPAGSNVVSVQSVVGISTPIYTSGSDPKDHLEAITKMLGEGLCKPWTFLGITRGYMGPTLILSPLVAKVLADNGLTKDDLRRYLHENARMSAKELEEYDRWRIGTKNFGGLDRDQWARLGEFVPQLAGITREEAARTDWTWSDEPDIPIFPWADHVGIVVAGDPFRNQSRGYICNHRQGRMVTKPVFTVD